MAQEAVYITLGELLDEAGETEVDNEILERVKLLAQEQLPEGWTAWKVTRRSKEDIFGEQIDPQTLNKLRFALPTELLAKAFVPEATRLSEKGFRDLKVKMLDWAFARALITSPPAICNRIRGSAAATELFNEAVRPKRPMSRKEADRALSLEADADFTQSRRRHFSSDPESSDAWASRPKRSKVDALEQHMNQMFATLMERMDSLGEKKRDRTPSRLAEYPEESSDEENHPPDLSRSTSPDDWQAPLVGSDFNVSPNQVDLPELEFLPNVKEAEPAIPTPSEHIMAEGIACQRFGSDAWNRIRYKEVEKRLHASPVFSTLKINAELTELGPASGHLSRQDGMLGTVTHGLLCQRKALAEELKKLAKKFPAAAEDLKNLMSDESNFKTISDNILQYVCAHRAEALDMRRRVFKPKNEALSSLLQKIPPSSTHLFQEVKLSEFIRDNGGMARIFPSRSGRFPEKQRAFQRNRQTTRYSGPSKAPKSKQPAQKYIQRQRQTRNDQAKPSQTKRSEKRNQNQQHHKH